MLNRVILIGRLTRDPELRYTSSGIAVTQFTLAVEKSFSNQNGQREADFIPIVTWRQLAETCANYLRKGRLAAVEGRIQVRSYDNNEGRRVYVTEIVADNVRFLERNRDNGATHDDMGGGYSASPQPHVPAHEEHSNYREQTKDPFSDDGKPIDISDNDLPF